VICEDDAKINSLLDKSPPCLKQLVYIKEVKPETLQRAKRQGMAIIKFDEVEKLGSAHSASHREIVMS